MQLLHWWPCCELVLRRRWTRTPVTPISIHGVCVETVEDYKYLSVHMGNKLAFIKNTEALYKQGHRGLFLRLPRYLIICQLLRIRRSLWWPVFLCCGVLGQQTPTDLTNSTKGQWHTGGGACRQYWKTLHNISMLCCEHIKQKTHATTKPQDTV